ncbi:MAG: tetratricopeptide repeat protein [Paracoccus sp. (in: a-proteobacteria)]
MPTQCTIAPAAIAGILARANQLRQSGQHNDSITCLTKALNDHPDNGSLLHSLSISYRLAGNYDKSICLSDAILSRIPGNIFALMARADTAAHFGQTDRALLWIDEAIALAPNHLPFQIRKCNFLRRAMRPAEGVALLRKLARRHLENTTILRELALSTQAAGDMQTCLEACRCLLAISPQDQQARLLQTEALTRLHHPNAALTLVNEFLRDHPAHLHAHIRKAGLLRETGRCQDAIARLTRLSQRHPENSAVLCALATCYRRIGDHKIALSLLDQVLSKSAADRTALLTKVEIVQNMQDQPKLELILNEISAQLNTAVDPVPQVVFAIAICKGLNATSQSQAEWLLRQHAKALVLLAPQLPSQQLWTACLVADRLGLASMASTLTNALMLRSIIDIAVARQILMVSFRAGLPNWQRIAEYIHHRIPEMDRNTFLIEIASLREMPDRALSLRKEQKSQRRPERVLLISRLLKQQGRIRVAARYLGFARRVFDRDPALLQDHLTCLCGAGLADQAYQVLSMAEKASDMPPQWYSAIALGLIQLDKPERAVRLLDQTAPALAVRQDWYVAQVLTGFDQHRYTRLVQALHAQTDPHFAPSIRGLLLAEGQRPANQVTAPELAGDLVLPAIRRLSGWTGEDMTSAIPQIPRLIVQYWAQGAPPAQIRPAIESWQYATGFQHELFDGISARSFLHDHLGADWLQAFNRAQSPTEESDFFRLCRLAVTGGAYVDCDDWLVGDPECLWTHAPQLTVFREPTGAVCNNVIISPPHHPAIIWAAVAAKRALLEHHNENTWGKTGPGLLTRAIARHIDRSENTGTSPSTRILPQWVLGRTVQFHSPMAYKMGSGYWNTHNRAGRLQCLTHWDFPPAQYLGSVDKRGSQGGLTVIQADICKGDQLGAQPDDRQRMGIF